MSARSAVDGGLRLAAALVLASVFVTALHDASQAWDSWYYHLPFAARLAGIVPRDAFVFHPANEARFAGFTLLAERVQGVLWRLTGRPEAANLVAFGSVPLFAAFLRWRFAVPLHLSILALFAIPLVQTHATAAYVDLPANAALGAAWLCAVESWVSVEDAPPLLLVAGLASAAVAANAKTQLQPLTALACVVLAVRVLPQLFSRARDPQTRGRALVGLACFALAMPVVFATPLTNLAVHGNPYYPLRLTVLGHTLPGIEAPYSASPPWLAHAPRPFRFLCSLLEIGIRPLGEERRWTVDQWMPDDSMGNRMGGFFGAYVVVATLALVWRVARDRSRQVRVVGGGMALLTAAVSLMPQSHELRYYLVWMLVLVASNLWLACRAGATPSALPRAMGVVALLAFGVVAFVTRGAYVLPIGTRFEGLLATKVDQSRLDAVQEGERICVVREPWNLLWASTFHPPRHYVVVEAESREECGDARPLD